MDKKDEIISSDGQEVELDSGIQALADMADKMGEENPDSEYNEAGFNNEGIHRNGTRYDDEGYGADGFNSEGIHRNGTRYDDEGYGADGFDEIGVDREGFDYMGFGADGRDRNGYDEKGFDVNGRNKRGFDREGYDKNGRNIRGFNRAGINYITGTKYDVYGYDSKGFDRDGYDNRGYGKDGFSKLTGFNRDGIHKETGTRFDPDGWNEERDINEKTGDEYDPEGFDYFGYDKDGRDKDGYNLAGYDIKGFSRKGRHRETGTQYDPEGFDKDGYTEEYNAKFNKYGVDENGYMKNGEMDPDVEFAINFSESGIRNQNKFAAEKGMDEKEVRDKIELARKKCPNVDEIIKDLLLTGNKMRVAAISNDCDKFIGGELSTKEFWDKHPKLNISDMLSNFISDPDKKKQFSDRTIESLVLDSDNIEGNLRIFGTSQYDVSGALKGIEDFKKLYTRFGTDGTPEQLQKKRENTKKVFDTIKYLNRYKSRNLDSLLGSRQSFDGGQTWIEFNGETIGQAMDALKKDKKLICVQTVKDYIINQAKS